MCSTTPNRLTTSLMKSVEIRIQIIRRDSFILNVSPYLPCTTYKQKHYQHLPWDEMVDSATFDHSVVLLRVNPYYYIFCHFSSNNLFPKKFLQHIGSSSNDKAKKINNILHNLQIIRNKFPGTAIICFTLKANNNKY